MSALGQLNPIRNAQAWDTVRVTDIVSMGLAELSDWAREYEWDVKKGKGTVGATTTFTQKPPAKGSVKYWLWTEDHFNALDTFIAAHKYDPTRTSANALDIFHPALDALDITSVVTTKIGQVVHEKKQFYSLTIEYLEYFPAANKSAVSTPNASTGVPPAGGAANQQTPEEQEIAALLQKAQAA